MGISVKEGLTRSSLGNIPLIILTVDDICDYIYANPVEVDLEGSYSFQDIIKEFSELYQSDERLWSTIGGKCKHCEFVSQENDNGLKSGFIECWKHATNLSEDQLQSPLVLELWGGRIDKAIADGIYLLKDLKETYYWPKEFEARTGLHPAERKRLQIEKARNGDSTPYLDTEGLKRIFDELEPPYHFIDFETTMVALPFHAGRRPYEGIAFQYSYHLMDENGNIHHKGQFLNPDQHFPNYNFVRALKNDLADTKGTIFRYHNHENTYLRTIRKQLLNERNENVTDKKELIDFIDQITHAKEEKFEGPRDMVDLFALVLSYYYSPFAKGSNSIKAILPAVIHDSEFIREKYSKPIYGNATIPSLNFTNHQWIQADKEMNPYKTLPQILDKYSNEYLEEFHPMPNEEIRDGGAAMMAYSYLQFTDIHPVQKKAIREALLKYCELDTMAMVMIWEYWRSAV